MSRPQQLLDAFHCLADATRLRLLALLQRHELGVAELCEILQMPQSTVSRHLKVLSDHHWVRSRGHKTANLYRMLGDHDLDAAAKGLWALSSEKISGWPELTQDTLRLAPILQRRRANAFFSHSAKRWMAVREGLYGKSFNVALLAALLPPEAVIADLACGTGELATLLAPHVNRVYGVDRSTEMLAEARARTARCDNVVLLQGDIQHLPLPDGSCDAVLMSLALTYVEQPELALKEAARLLRPGGRAVVVTLLEYDRSDFRIELEHIWPGFKPEQLKTWLTNAGLLDATCRPLPPEAGVKGPALILATGLAPQVAR